MGLVLAVITVSRDSILGEIIGRKQKAIFDVGKVMAVVLYIGCKIYAVWYKIKINK